MSRKLTVTNLRKEVRRRFIRAPIPVRHYEPSVLMSADDEGARPTEALIGLALDAARLAQEADLHEVSERLGAGPRYPDVWPGEHYKLLVGLARALEARTVIEIGTSVGLGSLTLAHALPAGGRVVTYDVQAWDTYPDTVLTEADMTGGAIEQRLDDLSSAEGVERNRDVIAAAELVFVDAEKDGRMEQRFLDALRPIARHAVVVIDDIRLWEMLAIWRRIEDPKLDLTSFGHWSGTGLVDWRR